MNQKFIYTDVQTKDNSEWGMLPLGWTLHQYDKGMQPLTPWVSWTPPKQSASKYDLFITTIRPESDKYQTRLENGYVWHAKLIYFRRIKYENVYGTEYNIQGTPVWVYNTNSLEDMSEKLYTFHKEIAYSPELLDAYAALNDDTIH